MVGLRDLRNAAVKHGKNRCIIEGILAQGGLGDSGIVCELGGQVSVLSPLVVLLDLISSRTLHSFFRVSAFLE